MGSVSLEGMEGGDRHDQFTNDRPTKVGSGGRHPAGPTPILRDACRIGGMSQGENETPEGEPLSAADVASGEGQQDVTAIIKRVEAGDEDASTELWNLCFPRLLNYCRNKLPDHMRRILDEEDVALSAFKSFCIGAGNGAFGDIKGRDELWRLLFCIAGRKASGYLRHQTRQKRGGGQVSGESIFLSGDRPSSVDGIEQIADTAQSPASMAQFANDCQKLFDMLDDNNLQTIALLRIEGHSVDEIADRVGCAKRTVERRLNLIREIWKSVDNDESDQPTASDKDT